MTLKKQLIYYPNDIETFFGGIANAQGGSAINSQSNYVDLTPVATENMFVDSLIATSSDSVNQVVIIARKVAGTYRPIGAVQILANAGTNGTVAAVDLLSGAIIQGLSLNNQGKRYIRIKAGDVLAVKTAAAVTAGTAEVRITGSASKMEAGEA